MLRNSRSLSFLVIAALASTAAAQTASCSPSWTPGFFNGGLGQVSAEAIFDDGTGPALYAAADVIRKLTPAGWQPLPAPPFPFVTALAAFDDGTGSKLYAGGTYGVARWNGASWAMVGSLNDYVLTLGTATVGGVTSLYAGGNFTASGPQPVNRIARWTGSAWVQVGPGLTNPVRAVLGFDDGTGPALYVAGGSLAPSNSPSSFLGQVARWNGSTWTSVGNLTGFYYHASTLEAFDDGTGAALYVGGQDYTQSTTDVFRWSGGSWTTLGTGLTQTMSSTASVVTAMRGFDDGSGPALYVVGGFQIAGGIAAPGVARWTGSGWQALGNSLANGASSLLPFDDGTGMALWAGSVRWNGTTWSYPGLGFYASSGGVQSLAALNLGSGPELIAGGGFAAQTTPYLVRFDGQSWSSVGAGLGGPINAMTTFDDGGGPALHVGGSFSISSGAPANGLARWNGTIWSSIGDINGVPYAFAVDETAPSLYVGGAFSSVGTLTVNNVAKFDGASWIPIGAGLNGPVRAMAVYDDGTGPALYIGGDFTYASGSPTSGIAKWTGSQWAPIGPGVGGGQPFVRSLAVFDSIGGPALYVSGTFTTAGGLPIQGIARITGSTWSSVGSANNSVHALTVFDLGDGPELYAGGDFTTIGGVSANGLARWNGTSWSPLGSATTGVRALGGIEDRSGRALWIGGGFATAGGYQSSNIARYAVAAPVLSSPLTSPVGSPLIFGIQGATPSVPYVLDFSISGSAPGFDLGPVHIPMNEPLVNYTFGYLFPGVFSNFWGYLDGNGQGTAQLNLPNDPILSGFTLSSSFVTLDFAAPFGIGGVACPRTTTIIPAKPKILTVSPPSAPATGGPTITIGGSGFQPGATVRIGAGYGTNLTIAPNTITCTAPAGNVGPVTVRVDNPNATSATKSGAFAYVTPIAITAAAPVVAANGATITVDGAGFQTGATVTIGGVNAPVTNLGPAQIQCTWPAGVPCDTTLVVHDPDGQTASTPFNPSPTITVIPGGSGPAAGGTSAFILGTNFHPGTTVTIGGAVASIQSQDLNSILVTVPPGTPGPAPVIVTSASGCTASGTYIYY